MNSIYVKNLLLTYGSQIYMAVIGILCMPFFLNTLGASDYAFIGLFTFIQALVVVFDAGISPALARTIAAEKTKSKNQFLHLLTKSLETLNLSVALLIIIVGFITKDYVVDSFLKIQDPDSNYYITVLLLITASAFRFTSMVLRAGLQGFEDFKTLNTLQLLLTTIRFPIVASILYIWPYIELFFVVQIMCSVVEWAVQRLKLSQHFNLKLGIPGYFSRDAIRAIHKLAGTIAITTLIAAIVGQLDKLVVANILDIESFGFFSISAVVANGILLVGLPVGNVLIPRLANSANESSSIGFNKLYIRTSQYIAISVSAVAVTLATFPQTSIWVLTANVDAAYWSKSILPWYAAGNCAVVIAGFNYYMQSSIGNVRMHLVYSVLMLVLSIPATVFLAYNSGLTAMLIAWALFRIAGLVIWTPMVHKKLRSEIFYPWIFIVLLPICFIWIVPLFINDQLIPISNRVFSLLILGVFFATIIVIGFTLSFTLKFGCNRYYGTSY